MKLAINKCVNVLHHHEISIRKFWPRTASATRLLAYTHPMVCVRAAHSAVDAFFSEDTECTLKVT